MVVFLAADRERLEELDSAVRDYLGWSHVLQHEADLDLTQNQKNQAAQRRDTADQTATSRLLQTFAWALVPTQPDPAQPFVIRETKVEGQSDSLAERVSRRLGNDGDLAVRHAATAVRIAIGKAPRIWEKGHVALGDLWSLYAQYPYMPRLRDRSVLASGVSDMPLLWSTDAFALAEGYDSSADRYVGLWTPDGGGGSAPSATDALLLVRPEVASRQFASERRVPDDDGQVPPRPPEPKPRPVDIIEPPGDIRYYGVKHLRSERLAVDFKDIAEEILAHLRGRGTNLQVRIEIEATNPDGFDESVVRTVRENANTLKFEQSGFESQ